MSESGNRWCSGVFEGGGVLGIGHIGAVWEMEQEGFRFADLAGSSAGAVVAALLAAGYHSRELRNEMNSLDYQKLKGRDFIDHFGTLGKLCSIILHFGIYDLDYLEQWVGGLLEQKGIRTFGDLKKTGRTLKITASDLTARHLLILPDDFAQLGICPDDFSIALAVRMSAGIPIFFEPVRLKDQKGREHLIADGGLLSNFPIWLLGKKCFKEKGPAFGFRFADSRDQDWCSSGSECWNLIDYLKAMAAACMDATDYSLTSARDLLRTVEISPVIEIGGGPHKVSAVDFDIGQEERLALFENGRTAARNFLKRR